MIILVNKCCAEQTAVFRCLLAPFCHILSYIRLHNQLICILQTSGLAQKREVSWYLGRSLNEGAVYDVIINNWKVQWHPRWLTDPVACPWCGGTGGSWPCQSSLGWRHRVEPSIIGGGSWTYQSLVTASCTVPYFKLRPRYQLTSLWKTPPLHISVTATHCSRNNL